MKAGLVSSRDPLFNKQRRAREAGTLSESCEPIYSFTALFALFVIAAGLGGGLRLTCRLILVSYSCYAKARN